MARTTIREVGSSGEVDELLQDRLSLPLIFGASDEYQIAAADRSVAHDLGRTSVSPADPEPTGCMRTETDAIR